MKKYNFKTNIGIILLILFAITIISSDFIHDDETKNKANIKLLAKLIDFKYIEETNKTVFTVYYEWEWIKKTKISDPIYDMIKFKWTNGFSEDKLKKDNSMQEITYESLENNNMKKNIYFQIENQTPKKISNTAFILFPQKITKDMNALKGNGLISISSKGRKENVGMLISYIKNIKSTGTNKEKLPVYNESQIVESTTIHGLDINIQSEK